MAAIIKSHPVLTTSYISDGVMSAVERVAAAAGEGGWTVEPLGGKHQLLREARCRHIMLMEETIIRELGENTYVGLLLKQELNKLVEGKHHPK